MEIKNLLDMKNALNKCKEEDLKKCDIGLNEDGVISVTAKFEKEYDYHSQYLTLIQNNEALKDVIRFFENKLHPEVANAKEIKDEDEGE